mmetsp:Transcript_76969/g.249362  ORF Transcript_76969/g.249362 Transcript_76969/m.249362 type:complete len:350 (+) Transcript_76969:19-1068(+)
MGGRERGSAQRGRILTQLASALVVGLVTVRRASAAAVRAAQQPPAAAAAAAWASHTTGPRQRQKRGTLTHADTEGANSSLEVADIRHRSIRHSCPCAGSSSTRRQPPSHAPVALKSLGAGRGERRPEVSDRPGQGAVQAHRHDRRGLLQQTELASGPQQALGRRPQQRRRGRREERAGEEAVEVFGSQHPHLIVEEQWRASLERRAARDHAPQLRDEGADELPAQGQHRGQADVPTQRSAAAMLIGEVHLRSGPAPDLPAAGAAAPLLGQGAQPRGAVRGAASPGGRRRYRREDPCGVVAVDMCHSPLAAPVRRRIVVGGIRGEASQPCWRRQPLPLLRTAGRARRGRR